jgi:hypothetical protein
MVSRSLNNAHTLNAPFCCTSSHWCDVAIMKVFFWPYVISTLFLLPVGCTSHPKPDSRAVTVATYQISDKACRALIYDTLRQHGIVAIGVGSGGWEDVTVGESRAAQARRILSGLSTEGHSFRVIDE